MGQSPTPVEILRISKRYGGIATTIDRPDPRHGSHPVWKVMTDESGRTAIVHTDPRQQDAAGPLGIAQYHTLSHKIDVTYRGVEFCMKDDRSLSSIKSRHAFHAPGAGEDKMTWRRSTLSDGVMYFENSAGRRLACFKKKPADGKRSPVIELYVPPATLDLDLLVVTAMAVVGYARKNKTEGELL
ncbi:hypothetical protein F5X68DRAFT_50565 [Plectosphaerella plurivora]|uniref:Uncharacterized protein n=1 Tax=Plectosphaerella plurivora TaxID=936078 RepID=A0A9P8V2Z8_9PEZI|nr:hypothetical protein F5X68DRAFT_50565 [Plectosphaerella plurivora]